MEKEEYGGSYSSKVLRKKILKHKKMINVCEKYQGLDSATYHMKDSNEKIKDLECALSILEEHGF